MGMCVYVCVCVCVCVCACMLSHIRLFAAQWTVALQSSLPMEFSRQEYQSTISYSRGSSQPRD